MLEKILAAGDVEVALDAFVDLRWLPDHGPNLALKDHLLLQRAQVIVSGWSRPKSVYRAVGDHRVPNVCAEPKRMRRAESKDISSSIAA